MGTKFHSFWVLFYGGPLLRYHTVIPNPIVPVLNSWAVPGADSHVGIGLSLLNTDKYATVIDEGESLPDVERMFTQKISILAQSPETQQDHLRKLSSKEQLAKDTVPDLVQFLDEFDDAHELKTEIRVVLLQRTVKRLLNIHDMPEDHVAAWVDLLMYRYRPWVQGHVFSKAPVDEQVHALYGLYSLRNRYNAEGKEAIVGYIDRAISIFRERIEDNRLTQESVRAQAPWVKEMLMTDNKLSYEMSIYDRFEQLTSYEPNFNMIRHAIRDEEGHEVRNQLPILQKLARKETPNVSAQSKTAAIIYLYHVATMDKQWIKQGNTRTRQLAARLIHQLTQENLKGDEKHPVLALHDLRLANKIWEEMMK